MATIYTMIARGVSLTVAYSVDEFSEALVSMRINRKGRGAISKFQACVRVQRLLG